MQTTSDAMTEYIKFTPLIALTVALIALFFTIRNYWRKAGILVRGSVSFGSSIQGNDIFIRKIVLENLKDRAITIFGIYVKIAHSYYIEVEDFDTRPLILKPFETYHKEYGPIEFYSVNMNRIRLDNLLKNDSVRKTVILATSDGRYKVPRRIPRWHPLTEFFKNYMTAVIKPVRAKFDDQDLGSNTRYVIEGFHKDGGREVVLVHPEDYRFVKFKKLCLTRESLSSKEALDKLLHEAKKAGDISWERIVVHDVDEWRKDVHQNYITSPIIAVQYGIFRYYVLGRLGTILKNRQMRRANNAVADVRLGSHSSRIHPADD
jgi:hypothetical protein